MAELLEIPTPLQVGVTGTWSGKWFEVAGRIQMDRAGAPGAPWQEMLLVFEDQSHTWVAYAQGRWYHSTETPPATQLPAFEQLGPGSQVNLGQHGNWVVQEVAQRRVVSGEGMMSEVPKPDVTTRYADISAQGGAFGTIDYGDGSEAPTLYLGRQFDPKELTLEGGVPLEAPETKVSNVECPNCGGDLPLMSGQAQRVICQYCNVASDVAEGNLSMLGPAPPPPVPPYIPIGARGNLRGADMTVTGFMVRSCIVEGIRYAWREYLLFGGESVGYWWLTEEDGNWSIAQPVETGDVSVQGSSATYRGAQYGFKQRVTANVENVVGEFYWQVELGESADATEFEGPGGKISREQTPNELTFSFITPLDPNELAAFGVAPPTNLATGGGGSGGGEDAGWSGCIWMVVLIFVCFILMMMSGECGGSSGGYGGGSWSK